MRKGQTQYFPPPRTFSASLLDRRNLCSMLPMTNATPPDIELEPLDTLHAKVQLHERINIYYVVDGYTAAFDTADGDDTVYEAHGETIQDALIALDKMIPKDWTREHHYLTRAESREHVGATT